MKQSKTEIQKRHKQILDLFYVQNTLHVTDVSEQLGVSEITVRRDFMQLEEKGYLERFHGGAKLRAADTDTVPQFENKGALHLSQKMQIAKMVTEMIDPNDTIFLNGGSTTLEIIRNLKDKPVRIITNNALAMGAMSGGSAELICTGGEYSEQTCSFIGDLATSLINKVYATCCILGVNGISSRDGITTYAYQETMLNELMVKRCKGKRIVAADGSKVGKTFCFTSTAVTNIDILVTDSSADPDELERIRECGVRIILADQTV